MKTIQYFFDFLSPFSYFSWVNSTKFRNGNGKIAEKYRFEYYPLLMAKLFAHHQQKGPGEIPPKRDFLFKECLRYVEEQKIPFNVPHHLPFNPMLCLRIASQKCAGTDQEKVIDTLWKFIWVEEGDMESPDDVAARLSQEGFNGEELIEKAFSAEIKAELKINIEKGIRRNLFGVPSFCVENELFWGNDSLVNLEKYLLGEDTYDQGKWQNFLSKLK